MKRVLVLIILLVLASGGFVLYQSQVIPAERPNPQAMPLSCNGRPIPQQTEGPYYKSGSPQTTNLYRKGMPGEKVTVTGYVLDTNCKPIAHALIDFWQANGNGEYDNDGYTLRGYQYTDEQGKFNLVTVIPGEYPGRTPHIHFKVRASENSEIITSQLYLPNATRNSTDAIFNDDLVMDISDTPEGKIATYTIVIPR